MHEYFGSAITYKDPSMTEKPKSPSRLRYRGLVVLNPKSKNLSGFAESY